MEKPVIEFETENLIVRPVAEEDKGYYMPLRIENSDIKVAYDSMPEFKDNEWKGELNNTEDCYLCIFLKPQNTFVGSGSLQGVDSDCPELGADVVKEYQNKGIGTEFIRGILKKAHDLYPGKRIKARTNADNIACRKMIEKCGGVFSGFEATPAAKVMEKLLEMTKEDEARTEEEKATREQNRKFVEDNKEGVCVYYFE